MRNETKNPIKNAGKTGGNNYKEKTVIIRNYIIEKTDKNLFLH